MKKIVSVVLLFAVCLVSFSSCTFVTDALEAEKLLKSFVEVLAQGDVDAAMEYIHPSSEITRSDVVFLIDTLKTDYKIELSDGVEYLSCTNLSTNWSLTGSAFFQIGYYAEVGERTIQISGALAKDDEGFGITAFAITSTLQIG